MPTADEMAATVAAWYAACDSTTAEGDLEAITLARRYNRARRAGGPPAITREGRMIDRLHERGWLRYVDCRTGGDRSIGRGWHSFVEAG